MPLIINIDTIQSTENDADEYHYLHGFKKIQKQDSLQETANSIGARAEGATTISKVSTVGVGMISKPGVAAKILRLGEAANQYELITTSEIKVSQVIEEADAEQA